MNIVSLIHERLAAPLLLFATAAFLGLASIGASAVTPVPAGGALMPASQFLPEKPGFTGKNCDAGISAPPAGTGVTALAPMLARPKNAVVANNKSGAAKRS